MNKRNYVIVGIFLLLLFSQPFFVFSQTSKTSFLNVELKAYLVTIEKNDQGAIHEVLKPLPETVMPGDIIHYEIVAFNTSKGCACTDTLKEIALLGAIPEGTVFIEHSETSSYAPVFSIDGGETYSVWPVKYKVLEANGKAVEKIAGADLIMHIKWVLPALKPQETISLMYRVVVKAKE